MPKGYIYAEVEVFNALAYENLRSEVLNLVSVHGGRFIVRRGDPLLLAGERDVSLVMIIEFRDRDTALHCYEAFSATYKTSGQGAFIRMILLSGTSDMDE